MKKLNHSSFKFVSKGAFHLSELDQSVGKWNWLFPRVFAEKPSPLVHTQDLTYMAGEFWWKWKLSWRLEWSGRSVLTNGKAPKRVLISLEVSWNASHFLSPIHPCILCHILLNSFSLLSTTQTLTRMAMFSLGSWINTTIFVILTDACKYNNPCKNGATCSPNGDSLTCQCTANFQGEHCDKGNEIVTLKWLIQQI